MGVSRNRASIASKITDFQFQFSFALVGVGHHVQGGSRRQFTTKTAKTACVYRRMIGVCRYRCLLSCTEHAPRGTVEMPVFGNKISDSGTELCERISWQAGLGRSLVRCLMFGRERIRGRGWLASHFKIKPALPMLALRPCRQGVRCCPRRSTLLSAAGKVECEGFRLA